MSAVSSKIIAVVSQAARHLLTSTALTERPELAGMRAQNSPIEGLPPGPPLNMAQHFPTNSGGFWIPHRNAMQQAIPGTGTPIIGGAATKIVDVAPWIIHSTGCMVFSGKVTEGIAVATRESLLPTEPSA